MSDAAVHAAGHGHHEPRYLFQFAKLGVLTAAEVAIALVQPGGPGLTLGLLAFLSLWKAGVVGKHYMHLGFEPKALVIIVMFPLLLIGILILGLCLDIVILGQGTPYPH